VVSHQNSIGFDPKAVRHVVDEIKRHKGDLVSTSRWGRVVGRPRDRGD
jgi:hypothetical protein